MTFIADFKPDILVWGCTTVTGGAANRLNAGIVSVSAIGGGRYDHVITRDGVLKRFFMRHTKTVVGGAMTYTVVVNLASDPNLELVLDTSEQGPVYNLVDEAIVSAGDSIEINANNGPGGGQAVFPVATLEFHLI